MENKILKDYQDQEARKYGYLNFEDWLDTKHLSESDADFINNMFENYGQAMYNQALNDAIEKVEPGEDLKLIRELQELKL